MRSNKNNSIEKRVGVVKRFFLAFFALVVAILIWFAGVVVDNTKIVKVYKDVPLVFINEDHLEELSLSYEKPEKATIDVMLQGYFSDIISIEADSIKAVIDLSRQTQSGQTRDIPEIIGCNEKVIVLDVKEVDFEIKKLK